MTLVEHTQHIENATTAPSSDAVNMGLVDSLRENKYAAVINVVAEMKFFKNFFKCLYSAYYHCM